MASMEVVPSQSVVTRVVSLPLVSSTYDLVSNVYCNTKDNHPYLRSVCEVAEMGVKTITSVAMSSAMPFIGKLEPQLAIANDLACKGLDKIEKSLPILHQPSEQIVANAKNVVTGAKEAVAVTVGGAKDGVSHTLTGVMDKTKGAVQDSMEKTKAMVSGGVNTVMSSRVAHLLSTGVDAALSKSETLVDQYLPLTEEELETEAKMVKGFDATPQKSSYYIRLGSLSVKLRKRAYHQAIEKIEYARKNVDDANQKLHEKFSSWVEWKSDEQSEGDWNEAEHIESRTLTIARNLSHQLQTTCLTLVSSLQGLPQNVQNQALSVARSASEVYDQFSKAPTLRDVSDNMLSSSKAQLGKMKDSLDGIMDYLVNNTPLNWLVPDIIITDLSSESDENEDHEVTNDLINAQSLQPITSMRN
ncbi:perilipin-2 isoform X3 [Brienomyrus brachyistius]|uniref:perilipin-2 isoform X3 n=1 Tax=Brienomyrus brachyistius TaxID=42636 RepID=UPI0020B17CB4|nr:perilipin-2 isoform X3 [Brienomyrus brachyistius]